MLEKSIINYNILANKVKNRDSNRWRYDAAGNIVLKPLNGCRGPICYEYDHIIPFSKSGETIVRNCQILQSYANNKKGNKFIVDTQKLKDISLKVNLSDYEMDFIEELIFGNVNYKY